jgi:hypothetical protein
MKQFYFLILAALMLAFTSLVNAQDIVITEIMYNPPEAGTDSLEFIELYNNDVVAVDLTGWSFTQGVSHTFGAVIMNPGDYLVVAKNASAIQNVYGYSTAIEWNSGALSNGGEAIVLATVGGAQTIDSVYYYNTIPWAGAEANGNGASIVLCDPSSDNTDPVNWYASITSSSVIVKGITVLGSPGFEDGVCAMLCNSVSTISVTDCGSYTVPSGNETYTTSGSYMDTIVNAVGCDSVITINLTINNSVTGTDFQVACGSYTWIDGVNYPASNNSAIFTFTGGAANGCDSIVTLDLTINNVATGTDVQAACGSYTWIDGTIYTASNNTATFAIVAGAANGCDSIVTLDLTINASNDAGVDSSLTVCMNEPIDFDTLSSLGTAGAWLDFTNTPVSGVVTLSSIPGDYEFSYIIYTSNNCPADTATYTITVDGTCDYLSVNTESMIDVSVYPNPASSILTIQNSSNTTSLKVEMLDMNGRIVLVKNEVFNNSMKANLVIDHLNKGIYTLRIYDEKSQKLFKIVKQ